MFALLESLMDSVYLQFCDFDSFFISFVFYNEFNPLSRWNIHKIFKCSLTQVPGGDYTDSLSPQHSERAIQAIPEEEEASFELHQLPEAVYH